MTKVNFWPVLYRDLLHPGRHTSGSRTEVKFYGPFTLDLSPGQTFSNARLWFHNRRGTLYFQTHLPECHFQWVEEELRIK